MKKLSVGSLSRTAVAASMCLAVATSLRPGTQAVLTATEKIQVASVDLSVGSGPPRCDANGNIYVRQPHFAGASAPPAFLKVSADGEHVTAFSPAAITDSALKGAPVSDFAVALNGEVYALVQTRQSYVAEFKDNGEFYSSTRLDGPRIYSIHLAVFPSGEFLVTGVKPDPRGGESGPPFTAIFDRAGELVREVSLAGDTPPHSDAADADGLNSSGAWVALGEAIPAEDGNIYIERSGVKGGRVYVISVSGNVLRSFGLNPPEADLRPGPMMISSGTLAIEFFSFVSDSATNLNLAQPPHAPIFSVHDAQTGRTLFNYGVAPGLSGSFACYKPGQFSFINGYGGRSYIIHAVPK